MAPGRPPHSGKVAFIQPLPYLAAAHARICGSGRYGRTEWPCSTSALHETQIRRNFLQIEPSVKSDAPCHRPAAPDLSRTLKPRERIAAPGRNRTDRCRGTIREIGHSFNLGLFYCPTCYRRVRQKVMNSVTLSHGDFRCSGDGANCEEWTSRFSVSVR